LRVHLGGKPVVLSADSPLAKSRPILRRADLTGDVITALNLLCSPFQLHHRQATAHFLLSPLIPSPWLISHHSKSIIKHRNPSFSQGEF
jgi:hypothetical protein